MALVRFFAAAKASAGDAERVVPVSTLSELLAELPKIYPASASVSAPSLDELLPRCAFLINGTRVSPTSGETASLADEAVVDVLPPFAGG